MTTPGGRNLVNRLDNPVPTDYNSPMTTTPETTTVAAPSVPHEVREHARRLIIDHLADEHGLCKAVIENLPLDDVVIFHAVFHNEHSGAV